METRRYLQGGLIIGVVWILVGASKLHFLTLISEKTCLGSILPTRKVGREPTFMAFYRLHHTCYLVHTHSRFLHLCCFSTLTPPPPTSPYTSEPGEKKELFCWIHQLDNKPVQTKPAQGILSTN